LIPFFLATDLALVVLFRMTVFSTHVQPAHRRAWAVVFTIIVIAKLSQCALSSRATTWWNTLEQNSTPVAQAIDRSRRPLLIDDNYLVYALALSEYLKPDVRVALHPRCFLCTNVQGRAFTLAGVRPQPFSDVFLLGPSERLQAEAQRERRTGAGQPHYHCIDVLDNCSSSLRLFNWSAGTIRRS
jgi:hypothetical protein